jgi:hypothetical protein
MRAPIRSDADHSDAPSGGTRANATAPDLGAPAVRSARAHAASVAGPDDEGPRHLPRPGARPRAALVGALACPRQGLGDRQRPPAPELAGEERALVESALARAFATEGHRHERRPLRRAGHTRHDDLRQHRRQPAPALVLQGRDQRRGRAGVRHRLAGALDRPPAGRAPCNRHRHGRAAPRAPRLRQGRQRGQAGSAGGAAGQAARRAGGGKDEVEQADRGHPRSLGPPGARGDARVSGARHAGAPASVAAASTAARSERS